ncbi:MAG: DUF89 family protein [Phycisphaeraceae bacterium]|nr:DUF89 family protein [Phycisphaeraceae bacterium]
MLEMKFSDDLTFPLLADPRGYVPCQWELKKSSPMTEYWLGLFRSHFPKLLAEAAREEADRGLDAADTAQRVRQAGTEFSRYLDLLTDNPSRFGRLDILTICIERERTLRRAGIVDPYRLPKTRENEAALACLPSVLRELDDLDDADRLARITHGIFAGNIFDLGATQTADLFKDGSVDFHAVRQRLAPRPWLIDDFEHWLSRTLGSGLSRKHENAILFVDNAGSDVILGMIPLARELLRRGTGVILTANRTPTLNDVTHDELLTLIDRIAAWDATIADARRNGQLELVTSGNGLPLIDLTRVSPELIAAMERKRVDLVVIEGMGRAVESNLDARFTCDVLKIAMIKDSGVADHLGGKLYDLVLRFEPV